MWLIFAVITAKNLKTLVVDVSSAFITELCPREVYVSVKDKYFRLNKFLYGLGDAPKGFYDNVSQHIIKGGYKRSVYEQCLFVKWISETEYVYIIIYVDDFVIASTHDHLIHEFTEHMQTKYIITTKKFNSYLGTAIEDQEDGSRVFTRPHQLDRLITNGLLMTIHSVRRPQ
jgi:hypothetical protein